MTILELNIQAETDSRIDRKLDELLVQKGDEDTALVFDSRMAWHFVPTSLKVHLVVAPEIGATRIAVSRTSATESYKTVPEAQRAVEDRATSERQRFLSRYGVDIARLRNYDVVIDTTDATPKEVVAKILDEVAVPSREQRLWVSPRRIIPTGNGVRLIGDATGLGTRGYLPSRLLFTTALLCGPRLQRAQRRDRPEADPGARQFGGRGRRGDCGTLTADNYIRSEIKLSWLRRWEDAHNFRFSSYPDYLRL